MQKSLLLLYILLSITISAFGYSVNVPMDYWGYDFFDRCETKGLCSSLDLRVKPISRMAAAKIILTIKKNAAEHPDRFSKTDQAQLDQIEGDFIDELQQLDANFKVRVAERHFLSHRENNSQVYVDLVASEKIIANNGPQYDPNQHISETTAGGIIRGQLGETIGFFAEARNSLIRGVDYEHESFDVSQGSPVVLSGSNAYSDRATAYFIWEKPWLRFEIGRDEMAWGPGYHSGLSLSGNVPPADLIKLRTRFNRFAFTSVHMFLNNSLGSKYLAGHRLDVELIRGLQVGATETVVYGDRDLELDYLNPLMLYHVAEHHLGDKDNNTMSVDFVLDRFPGMKIYGEWFIDDMTSAESLTGYFGNKFAFLTGIYLAGPLHIPDLDIRLEYSRVEPFVYSHKDSINIYSHYDKSIGHWLGSNADDLYFLAGYQFNRDVRAELTVERIRKGTGALSTVDRPASGYHKEFLGGTVENKNLFGVKLIDQIRRDLFISVSYTYSRGRDLEQTPDFNSNDHLARFELYLNY